MRLSNQKVFIGEVSKESIAALGIRHAGDSSIRIRRRSERNIRRMRTSARWTGQRGRACCDVEDVAGRFCKRSNRGWQRLLANNREQEPGDGMIPVSRFSLPVNSNSDLFSNRTRTGRRHGQFDSFGASL